MSTTDTATQLCVGCGMCCNGVLYKQAKVTPGEEERMAAAGLELVDDGGRRFFGQPCRHSSEGRCMIYETRFRICNTFECALLRRVNAGELGLAEAKEKVAEVQALLARVVAADPDAKTARDRIGVRKRLSEALKDGAGRAGIAQRLLNLIALDSFLERWFRLPNETFVADDQALEDPSSQ